MFVVTEAFKLPATVGLVVRVTVSDVNVAADTVPITPPPNVTVLLLATGSKPAPLINSRVPLSARLAVAVVTTGFTLATCTAVAMATPLVVTVAVKDPARGLVE